MASNKNKSKLKISKDSLFKTPVPFKQAIIDSLVEGKTAVTDNGDIEFFIGQSNIKDSSELVDWVDEGNELVDCPVYIKMPLGRLGEPVFPGLPNSEGNTWATWHDQNSTGAIEDPGEVWAIVSCQGFGSYLTSSEMALITSDNGFELMTSHDVRNLLRGA